MLKCVMAAIVILLLVTTDTVRAESVPARTHVASINVKFRLLVARGTSTEVEFDYATSPAIGTIVEGQGPVPPRGNLHYTTRSAFLRFLMPETNEVIATYDFKAETDNARRDLAHLGSSPAERLRRSEILHMLGDDSAAIPDLAVLASAGTLPLSTRNYAALQLGRAFAAGGDNNAAIAQFDRVARSGSPSAREEALVRRSNLQIATGHDADAQRTINSYFTASKQPLPSAYSVQARANQAYLSARSQAPALFASTTALAKLDTLDEDAKDEDFHEVSGMHPWKVVATYPLLVERLWQDIFKRTPGDSPCRPGVFCTTTSYWDIRDQINGRFARIAFRVVRWYSAPGAATKNAYKVEYAAQEELVDALGTWTPVKDIAVKSAVQEIINDLETRLRILSGSQ